MIINLEIPVDSYKILLDKMDSLEYENKQLRKWGKEKDILIKKQKQKIKEQWKVS